MSRGVKILLLAAGALFCMYNMNYGVTDRGGM